MTPEGIEKDEMLLNTKQVAAIIGLSPVTLEHLRLKGGGINFIKIGRTVRYRKSDVENWMAAQQTFRSTSDSVCNRMRAN